VWAPLRPTWRPNRPAMMLPNSGASTTAINRLLERVISICGSALQRIDFADIDGAAGTEQGHQDRQADRGLGRGHGHDEEHEQLPGGIAQLAREADEVDVDRKQHQLDRHQQDDDVLAVEEDAGDADAEQHRAQREVMAQRQALPEQIHHFASPSPAASAAGGSATGVSAGMLTMRKRSLAFTRAWSPGFWCLVPSRLRSVSITAAITATVRISAATSNGSRKSVNSRRASHVVFDTPSAAAA